MNLKNVAIVSKFGSNISEDAAKVIAKSVEDGHEESSRARVFREEHIGLTVLANFASLSISESAD